MGRKRNVIKEFMGYYLQLGSEGRQVIRDLLAAEGLDFKGKQPLPQQTPAMKPAGAGKRAVRKRAGLPQQDMTTPCVKEDCGLTSVNAIHDMNSTYVGRHPFELPALAAASQSSANNADSNGGASLETEMAAAGIAGETGE
jgi:hypothetical protein